jgi:hypothetical protein
VSECERLRLNLNSRNNCCTQEDDRGQAEYLQGDGAAAGEGLSGRFRQGY